MAGSGEGRCDDGVGRVVVGDRGWRETTSEGKLACECRGK